MMLITSPGGQLNASKMEQYMTTMISLTEIVIFGGFARMLKAGHTDTWTGPHVEMQGRI